VIRTSDVSAPELKLLDGIFVRDEIEGRRFAPIKCPTGSP